MKSIIFAVVILAVSFGVDCRRFQYVKELNSDMTQALKQLWTDSTTEANFKEAGEICASKNMRLATPHSEKDSKVVVEFIKSVIPKNGTYSFWALGKDDNVKQQAALIYTAWYDNDIFLNDIECAESVKDKLNQKVPFEEKKELFICEKL